MAHKDGVAEARFGAEEPPLAAGWGSPYLAGAIAGKAGLLVFLIVHAVWIVPIWSVVTLGVPVAAIGGAAAGWALDELREVVPRRPVRAWLAVTAGAMLVLSPTFVAAALGPHLPVPVVDGSSIGPIPPALIPRLATQFVVELLVLPMAAGALLGWALTRSRRAALATACAGVAFAAGPGHNNPFFFRFMDLPGSLFGVALTLAIVAVSSAVLVILDRRFAGGDPA